MNQAAAPTERAQLPGNLSRLQHASLGKEYEKKEEGRMESGAERWEARGIRKDKGRKQCGRIMREKACKDRKKGGGKRDVESEGATWGVQHQRSSAHHSFVISFAGAAGQSMYSFYIIRKRRQMVPDLKGASGGGERRRRQGWKYLIL